MKNAEHSLSAKARCSVANGSPVQKSEVRVNSVAGLVEVLTVDESTSAATLAAAAWPLADAFSVFVKLTPLTMSFTRETLLLLSADGDSPQPAAPK
jgi:hypothetical protein